MRATFPLAVLVTLLLLAAAAPATAAEPAATTVTSKTYVGGSYGTNVSPFCRDVADNTSVGGACNLATGGAALFRIRVTDDALGPVLFRYEGMASPGISCGVSGTAVGSVQVSAYGCSFFNLYPTFLATTGTACIRC